MFKPSVIYKILSVLEQIINIVLPILRNKNDKRNTQQQPFEHSQKQNTMEGTKETSR